MELLDSIGRVLDPSAEDGSRDGFAANGGRRGVKVTVQLLPETRLLLASANEEVEARRKAGQSEAKIWRD